MQHRKPFLPLVALLACGFLAAASGTASAAIEVTAPNGAEKIPAGSTYTVQWVPEDGAHHYSILFSRNGGARWLPVTTGVTALSYPWKVPVPAGNLENCLIRVVAFSAGGARVGADRSNANFAVNVIDVGTPSSGETLVARSTARISWDVFATRRRVARVRLSYSSDNGLTWTRVAALPVPAGGPVPAFFDWTVPDAAAARTRNRIRVELLDRFGASLGKDTNPGAFTIVPATVPGTPVVARGLMLKGSLILNGVHFSIPAGAPIVRDDNPATETELRDGMEVRVRGTRLDDGVSGVAEGVEAENELQGRVSGLNPAGNPPAFAVLGRTVVVSDATIFANFPAPGTLAALADGQFVEVHGLLDAAGRLRASRIELLAGPGAPATGLDEIKGVVATLTPTTFLIGALTVNYASATIRPPGASLAEGDPVEVHGSLDGAVLYASVVDREDLEDQEFEPAEGQHAEIEGIIENLVDNGGGAFTFRVGDATVDTAAATQFRLGSFEDLAEGVRVEVEGHRSGGSLVAEWVKFHESRIRIAGAATAASPAGLALLGIVVELDDLTDVSHATLPLEAGNRYQVRGYRTGGRIVAEEVRDTGGGKEILQGVVEAVSAGSVTILGITVDLSGAGTAFRNAQDAVISRAEFFATVGVGSLVKAKGSYAAGTLTAEEAEFEN